LLFKIFGVFLPLVRQGLLDDILQLVVVVSEYENVLHPFSQWNRLKVLNALKPDASDHGWPHDLPDNFFEVFELGLPHFKHISDFFTDGLELFVLNLHDLEVTQDFHELVGKISGESFHELEGSLDRITIILSNDLELLKDLSDSLSD
jgi:hypothetical protein